MTGVAIASWDWPAFEGGGVAALMATLASGCVDESVPVSVWTRGGGDRGRALAAAPAQPGVTVVGLPGRSWRSRGERHWRRGVQRVLPGGDVALVVVSSVDALPGVFAATPPHVPIACFAHGRDITGTLDPDRTAARAAALALPRVIWLCLTRWMRARLEERGVPAARVRLVPAAVPAPPTPLARRGGPVTALLTVGRLIARKGHDRVLDAVAALAPAHPGLRWRIVGQGPQGEPLARRVRALGLQDRVELMGALSAPALEAVWADTDIFVMPCREEPGGDTEGYGLVFVEAAARGIPCIGGATAGASEAVRAVGGVLVDPRAPRALAEAIEVMLADEAGTRARGAAARDRWRGSAQPGQLARAVLALRAPEVR